MGTVKVRKMLKSDLDTVMDIENKCFSVPWTREALLLEIDKNRFARYLVAELDGKVIGYGGMWMIMDEAHITNIAVHPDHRGKGYGNCIVEGLIATAKKDGILRLTLEVRRSNVVAQNLYKKYGFIFCGVRPGYYQDNQEDAIIMWRE